jgi:hypothetical protein
LTWQARSSPSKNKRATAKAVALRLLTKSLSAGCSKTYECKAQKKFKIDVYIDIHESLNFLKQRRNRGFFNNLRAAAKAAALFLSSD